MAVISIDGSMNRIEDAININVSTNKEDTLLLIYNGREISSFNDESLLKSSTTILAEGIKTNSEAKRRIIYSLESAVFFSFYAYDPYTGIPWYTTGYRLYLYLIQQEYKKKLFSGYGWYDMRASFDLKDMYIHWYDLGDGNSQGYNGSLADVHYSTTSDVTHYFCSRKDYTYNPYNLDLYVRQLDVRFWSSGISEDYAVTLNYAW